MHSSTLHRTGAALIALTLAVSIAGCTSQEPDSPAVPSSDSEAAALLPQDVKDRGYITIVTDLTYAPYGMLDDDGQTPIGIDVDTAAALQEVLGIEVKVENVSFDAFIPGLQASRYDAGFNAISDTPERREVVDFIDYNQFGGLYLTQPETDLEVTDHYSVCGYKVGDTKGSDTITYLEEVSAGCADKGKDPIDINVFGSQADALVALTSGRIDAVISGSAAGYNAEQSGGQYVVNGPPLTELNGDISLGGMAMPKDSPLADALLSALTELYDNGTLADIYAKYGINEDILIPPAINAA